VNPEKFGMNLRAITVAVVVALLLTACRPASTDTQERSAVQEVLNRYLESVKTADLNLAADVWWQSPDIVAVTPFGRFQGWERVKNDLYVNFLQKAFLERKLEPSNVVVGVNGEAAWVVFDWTFTARLANGQPLTSKGWESHVYRKTDRGWRIEHLHYSVPPPPQGPPPPEQRPD
jgi:ketosteroid isomerase-like protein